MDSVWLPASPIQPEPPDSDWRRPSLPSTENDRIATAPGNTGTWVPATSTLTEAEMVTVAWGRSDASTATEAVEVPYAHPPAAAEPLKTRPASTSWS